MTQCFMPILNVEVVLQPGEALRPTLAADIANAAGDVFGTPPGRTWVTVYTIPTEQYAENGSSVTGLYPVFVSILKNQLPAPEAMQTEARQLTDVIAQVCARSAENVHLIYLPAGAGRVAFGGRLIAT